MDVMRPKQYPEKLRDQVCEAFEQDKLDDALFYLGQLLRSEKRTIPVSVLRHLPINDEPYELLKGYCLTKEQIDGYHIHGQGDYFIVMRDAEIIGAELCKFDHENPFSPELLDFKLQGLMTYYSPFQHALVLIAYHHKGILTNWQSPTQYFYQNPQGYGGRRK